MRTHARHRPGKRLAVDAQDRAVERSAADTPAGVGRDCAGELVDLLGAHLEAPGRARAGRRHRFEASEARPLLGAELADALRSRLGVAAALRVGLLALGLPDVRREDQGQHDAAEQQAGDQDPKAAACPAPDPPGQLCDGWKRLVALWLAV